MNYRIIASDPLEIVLVEYHYNNQVITNCSDSFKPVLQSSEVTCSKSTCTGCYSEFY